MEKPVSERCPATSESKLCLHHQVGESGCDWYMSYIIWQSQSCAFTTRIFIHLLQHVGGTAEGPSLLMKEVLVFNQIGRGCGGYNSIGYFWTQEQLTMMIEPNMLKVFVLSLALSAMDYSVPKNTKCNKNLCFFIMRKNVEFCANLLFG